MAAQVNAPNKFTPQKFCSSSDTSLECVSQRNQANIDRYVDKYKEQVRQQKETQDAERLERDRLTLNPLDVSYSIQGHKVRVRTIDLGKEWPLIEADMLALV